MTDVLDLTKLSPSQLAQLQRILAAGMPSEPEVDYSKEPVVMLSADGVHVFRVDGDFLIDVNGDKHAPDTHKGFTRVPGTNIPLGHAPVAINGKTVESLEHHQGLRRGDKATLARYHRAKADTGSDKEAEEREEPERKPARKAARKAARKPAAKKGTLVTVGTKEGAN